MNEALSNSEYEALELNGAARLDRARGVLYGQIIGDNLGALVEFRTVEEIAAQYPDGVREMSDGGAHGIAAGQPTDDSEMALALARSLVRKGCYDKDDVRKSYVRWANSDAFDMGLATTAALVDDSPDSNSQANGALMRISPLAVAYWRDSSRAGELARVDAAITHPNPVCSEANAHYVAALADVIAGGEQGEEGVGKLLEWLEAQESAWLADWVDGVALLSNGEPDFSVHQGWLRLALWALLQELRMVTGACEVNHKTLEDQVQGDTATFEESLVRVIDRGGDTDTNAAIVGAFLGGLFGASGIPQRWRVAVENCVPMKNRPQEYHPNDASSLAGELLRLSGD